MSPFISFVMLNYQLISQLHYLSIFRLQNSPLKSCVYVNNIKKKKIAILINNLIFLIAVIPNNDGGEPPFNIN